MQKEQQCDRRKRKICVTFTSRVCFSFVRRHKRAANIREDEARALGNADGFFGPQPEGRTREAGDARKKYLDSGGAYSEHYCRGLRTPQLEGIKYTLIE